MLKKNWKLKEKKLDPLFKEIITEIPGPKGKIEAKLQMMVTTIEYNDYVGRLAVGRIARGKIKNGGEVSICRSDGSIVRDRISTLYKYYGLGKEEVQEAKVGDIVAIAGLEEINIGETIADVNDPEPLPVIEIEEPTVTMNFTTNDSPFAGLEGDYLTSRHLKRRLSKELESNVALNVQETDSPDTWQVSGRGELHLSILIETMRREGYEFQVSKPQVIMKEEDGQKLEPTEELLIDIPEKFMGNIMEEIGQRKGEMQNMTHLSSKRIRLEFEIPARGLIGFRSEFLTLTKGEGIINHTFSHYAPYKGDIPGRQHGSLLADKDGTVTRFGIFNAQERGTIFVDVGTKVYEGMIIGANARENDLNINICKEKKLTNMRAGSADEAIQLIPPTDLSLEQSLEYITDDEYVEITPDNIRIRKKILNSKQRIKAQKK
ncbi:GTP-binding protein TypA/BipA [Selenihalanaerobacter shriftii]|uniref:50S ribosomal subunit assembly factor BipA n=1 Tax=Selenihalanaerobacter shriftii TaxID=142842 RepID=A0A1T4JPR8_9FIRM|nr:GTP-binding protein TypA/BipA [Selenihalanaerobacter shriftii]